MFSPEDVGYFNGACRIYTSISALGSVQVGKKIPGGGQLLGQVRTMLPTLP